MSQASQLSRFRSAFRQCLQDRLDGLCLLCFGGFIAALSRSSLYWYFLNPRFSGLTLGAGALLCLCGAALVLRPTPGPSTPARLWRQAVLLAFLSLAATAWEQAAREPFDAGEAPATLSAPMPAPMPAPGEEPPTDPSPVLDGAHYTRLNLAELYIMLDKGRKDFPPRFALRAQVLRSPGLDAKGHVLLRRVAVVCCLADSLDLRFLARGADGEPLDGLRDGDWVEVFGSLEPLRGADKRLPETAPKGDGPGLAITNPAFRILARRVDLVSTPPFPYVFEFREKPPFAW